MKLFDAFNLAKADVVALVGGGGKTTTMFTLGSEARDLGLKTVLTTTTRIYCPKDPGLSIIINRTSQGLFSLLNSKLSAIPLVVAGAELAPDNKLLGLDPGLFPVMLEAGADLVIAEADGAARKPFKAPAAHEPVIPEASTVVIPVVGVDCLGQLLLPENVHRPELVADLTGSSLGEIITPEIVAKVLTHPAGLRKGVPGNCRWIPFINKVETNQDLKQAQEIARLVGETLSCRIVIGAAGRSSPVVEILDFT